ncbi:MAG: YndJ family protein [Blastocatellia bacterium]
MLKPATSSVIGGLVWLALLMVWRSSPLEVRWGVLLLLLAALVLIPVGLMCAAGSGQGLLRLAMMLQLPAALLLSYSFAQAPGRLAAGLALPWLLVTLLIALVGARRVWQRGFAMIEEHCADAGLIFLFVGGVWVVLAQSGARPLRFDPVIVLLTAIHFHYAGFVLPLLTGLAGRRLKDGLSRLAAAGVMAGVPLTAMGITATQLGFNHAFESLAALLTALAGWLTALLHFRLARQSGAARLIRGLWLAAALSLTFGMALAALYGLRFYIPSAWPDIPWMRALHGTANALGAGLCGLTGWCLAGRNTATQNSKQ